MAENVALAHFRLARAAAAGGDRERLLQAALELVAGDLTEEAGQR